MQLLMKWSSLGILMFGLLLVFQPNAAALRNTPTLAMKDDALVITTSNQRVKPICWTHVMYPNNSMRLVMRRSCNSNVSASAGKRKLIGSSPPKCVKKCGKCSPCKNVIVPINIPASPPTDYYPVAWRCKCGGKLYMP
eukprot:c13764_g1_i2 orf=373-786(-)